ncbi:MAG: glycosyltransferase family 9 protein [Deltaproteobacteria bacterium]|jgi:ADP-heptose:LPS heptosyltransferase|nr:glycosyltransferase family 9 protein [Deltaproteobacteria bacterium]
MKALVLALAKLGDFIQASPVFKSLSQRADEIYVLTAQKSVTEAAKISNLFTEVLEVDLKDPNLKNIPPGRLTVYNLSMAPPALALADKILAANPGSAIFGPHQRKGRLILPQAQEIALNVLKINRRLSPFNLVDIWRRIEPGFLADRKLFWPGNFSSEKYQQAGLVLGAGSPRRRWPREKFTAIAEILARKFGLRPVLLGGPGERALAKAVCQNISPETELTNLAGQTDLSELAGTVSGLRLLISGDTGVMHLGAALGTEVVSLFFGPAWAGETGPYRENQLVIQTPAPCAPCSEGRPCPSRLCQAVPEVCQAAEAVNCILNSKKPENLQGAFLTSLDSFGYKLTPLGEPTAEQRQALIIREGACAVLEPDYVPDLPGPEPGRRPQPDFFRAVALKIWPDSVSRKRFLEAADALGALG